MKALIPVLLLVFVTALSADDLITEPVCSYELHPGRKHDPYPYLVKKDGAMVTFVAIQDSGANKMISYGGQYFQYNPAQKALYHAEKRLDIKPASLQEAVIASFRVWAKSFCDYKG